MKFILFDTEFPLRQKILLSLTIIAGLIIFALHHFGMLNGLILNKWIFIYSFAVPLTLLSFRTLLDLNDKKIYTCWLIIGIILFAIYVFTKNNADLQIVLPKSKGNIAFENFLFNNATSPMKTLLLFLIVYQPFNYITKKLLKRPLLNTYRQSSWKHDTLNHRIRWIDVLFNFLLFALIFISIFLK